MISKLCPHINPARAAALQAIADLVFIKYGIISDTDKAAFLAQAAHESGEFSIKTENMNYTTPKRLVEIWPSRFGPGKKDPTEYVRNPKKLGNEVYKNRMGNGDFDSGDGYRFRGGGFIQLTGRDAYQKYADFIGKPLADTAALVRSDDYWAFDSAAWLYVKEKKLLGETNFTTITVKINGGLIGLGERKKYYERALEA